MRVRAVALAFAAMLPLALVACGDKGTDRKTSDDGTSPSEQLSEIGESGGMPKALTDCLTTELEEAGLSDQEFDDLIEALQAGDRSAIDAKTLPTYLRAAAACLDTTSTTEK